jgi:septum formation inhibitor-activating ATPase MinD
MMPPNEQGMGPASQAVCEAVINIAPEMSGVVDSDSGLHIILRTA